MTVQFILPEATSFPKERKLHDRLFLVLLYNLLCKTFKDHSSTFAASSRIRAHPSFARALLPDCECKGRAFLHSLQDFDKKKCEKNSFALILLLHSMAKSAVKSVFSLHPLPVISYPKPPFFVRFGHFWGKIHLFRGVFLFSSRDFLARNLCFRRKNQFDRVFLLGVRPNFDCCRRRKEERRRFSLPPPLHSKNTSRLSLKTSPLFATSSLVSLKTSPPRTNSHSILRAGHAPTRIYAPAHSANLPFLPSPFTLPCNKLCINRLKVKANPAFTFIFTATS